VKQNKTKKTIDGTKKLLGGLKTYKYNGKEKKKEKTIYKITI
tara:strand:+ start:98 stop:223 length:126 start_codon:yes stop_codon:yes gene_type:complete